MSRKFLLGDEVKVLSHDNLIGRIIYVFSEKEQSVKDIIVKFPDGTTVELSEGEVIQVDK